VFYGIARSVLSDIQAGRGFCVERKAWFERYRLEELFVSVLEADELQKSDIAKITMTEHGQFK
jgi:hypothetical protein